MPLQSISPRLRKATLAAELNGELYDAALPIHGDCTLKLLTFADDGGKWTYRHTGSHILAQAETPLAGSQACNRPAIDNGFYYDFDTDIPFSPEDFPKIEKEIAKIVSENLPLERF